MPPVTLMDKARTLAGKSALLILPIAAATPAQTATLQADYSFVGEHSSSGWFMSAASFNDLAAGATTSGNSARLTADHQVDDGMFWTWNDLAQETMRRYDVTGVAFAWGGGVTGAVFKALSLTMASALWASCTVRPIVRRQPRPASAPSKAPPSSQITRRSSPLS